MLHAKYTVHLKTLMDNEQTMQQLNTALSTYPLYEQKAQIETIIPKRSELNQRLLNAYKYREIGFETVGRFLDELQTVMNEIMPYYNELYKTVEIMAGLDNPFDNVDFTETYKETRNATSTNEANSITNNEANSTSTNEANSTSTNEADNTTEATDKTTTTADVNSYSKNVRSGTPQSQLDIAAKDIDTVNYADEANWSHSENSDKGTSEGENQSTSTTSSTQTTEANSTTNTEESGTTSTDLTGTTTTNDTIEHTFTKKGNQGVNTYAHDMIEFRQSIIDVTNKIINDNRIAELFMMIF